jgi:hypothetical protein
MAKKKSSSPYTSDYMQNQNSAWGAMTPAQRINYDSTGRAIGNVLGGIAVGSAGLAFSAGLSVPGTIAGLTAGALAVAAHVTAPRVIAPNRVVPKKKVAPKTPVKKKPVVNLGGR